MHRGVFFTSDCEELVIGIRRREVRTKAISARGKYIMILQLIVLFNRKSVPKHFTKSNGRVLSQGSNIAVRNCVCAPPLHL